MSLFGNFERRKAEKVKKAIVAINRIAQEDKPLKLFYILVSIIT